MPTLYNTPHPISNFPASTPVLPLPTIRVAGKRENSSDVGHADSVSCE